ncbi:MAG: DNA-binding response regulator [Nitrospira sp.]|nr:MAG: DNA-binding response regulator [Nitrospira sp.]
MKQRPIHMVLIDDHELVRKGLRSFLNLEQDLVIVGEAGTVADAVALVERLHPQMVLLDVKLPDASGMEACRRLLAIEPQLRILVLTSYAEDATVVAAVQSGAHGYVLKDIRTDDLIRAIHTVAEGRGYLDPRITQQALHWIRTSSHPGNHHQGIPQLSPQERLIMPLLAEGKTNKEIAVQLRLSDKTVKNYLANIFDKLHMKRRTEVVAWYMKEGRSGSMIRDT